MLNAHGVCSAAPESSPLFHAPLNPRLTLRWVCALCALPLSRAPRIGNVPNFGASPFLTKLRAHTPLRDWQELLSMSNWGGGPSVCSPVAELHFFRLSKPFCLSLAVCELKPSCASWRCSPAKLLNRAAQMQALRADYGALFSGYAGAQLSPLAMTRSRNARVAPRCSRCSLKQAAASLG